MREKESPGTGCMMIFQEERKAQHSQRPQRHQGWLAAFTERFLEVSEQQ